MNFFAIYEKKPRFQRLGAPEGRRKGENEAFSGVFWRDKRTVGFSAVFFGAFIQFSRLNLLFQDTEIEIHELFALLDRRQPLTFAVPALQRADRDIVRSSEICLHLLLKVRERIELEVLIEALVVVPVRTFHFSVMPGSPGLNQLMLDSILFAEPVQGVQLIQACLPGVSELGSVVGLYDLRLIPEIQKGSREEIYRIHSRLLFVGIYEALPGCFVYDGVLEEVAVGKDGVGSALERHELNVELPLLTDLLRGIVFLWRVVFLLRAVRIEALALKIAVERCRVPGVTVIEAQLAVELVKSDIRGSTYQVEYMALFLGGLLLRVRRQRAVRSVLKALKRSIVLLAPPAKRSIRTMVSMTHEFR